MILTDVFTGSRVITVPLEEKNFLFHAVHDEAHQSGDEAELIKLALDNPIDSPGFEAIPEGAKVVIIVDDTTRPTPAYKIIPHLLERLKKRTKNIFFATAPGTHRPLSETDLKAKIGAENLGQYPLINTDYTEKDKYKFFGQSNMGYPIYVREEILDMDYKITIGNIGPHNVVGWGGGAKMLMPGVCGEETVNGTHYKGAEFPALDVFGNENCRMRQEVDEIGGMIGLDFICNTILNDRKEILALFCGHYIKAHRAGVEFAKKALCPEVTALADIVVVSAYPSNIDYWQGYKPLGFSLRGLKPGGTVIYLFDAKEGLCDNSPAHKPMLHKYLKSDKETVFADVAAGKVEDIVGVTNPLYHFQVLNYAKRVICLTNGLNDEELNLLSFTKAETIEDALAMAFEDQGEDAKVGIIPFGSETLVRLAE